MLIAVYLASKRTQISKDCIFIHSYVKQFRLCSSLLFIGNIFRENRFFVAARIVARKYSSHNVKIYSQKETMLGVIFIGLLSYYCQTELLLDNCC